MFPCGKKMKLLLTYKWPLIDHFYSKLVIIIARKDPSLASDLLSVIVILLNKDSQSHDIHLRCFNARD